jgi:hypothetical protein
LRRRLHDWKDLRASQGCCIGSKCRSEHCDERAFELRWQQSLAQPVYPVWARTAFILLRFRRRVCRIIIELRQRHRAPVASTAEGSGLCAAGLRRAERSQRHCDERAFELRWQQSLAQPVYPVWARTAFILLGTVCRIIIELRQRHRAPVASTAEGSGLCAAGLRRAAEWHIPPRRSQRHCDERAFELRWQQSLAQPVYFEVSLRAL